MKSFAGARNTGGEHQCRSIAANSATRSGRHLCHSASLPHHAIVLASVSARPVPPARLLAAPAVTAVSVSRYVPRSSMQSTAALPMLFAPPPHVPPPSMLTAWQPPRHVAAACLGSTHQRHVTAACLGSTQHLSLRETPSSRETSSLRCFPTSHAALPTPRHPLPPPPTLPCPHHRMQCYHHAFGHGRRDGTQCCRVSATSSPAASRTRYDDLAQCGSIAIAAVLL